MQTTVAMTPPMGWNSFICFGWSVTEAEMKANIDYMAEKLLPTGWEYAVLDFCWYCPGADDRPSPNQTAELTPRLSMDANGRLLPDPARFPSSAGGKGLAPLAAYAHGKGLKFGLHIMRGIPRQAVAENTPVWESGQTAAEIADVDSICPWLNFMVGLDMEKPGAQAYLNSLFALYAAWGVDYIKIDDLSYPYHAAEIEGYRKAIDACGRPMVFSTSPGETPLAQGEHVAAHANLWRVSADFWDTWPELEAQFARMRDWTPYRRPGAWPDADMLPLGHISLRGPMREPRYCGFTPEEQRTMMTLWAIARSPLMMGGHLPDNPPETLALLTNAKVIEVNQRSRENCEVSHEDQLVVWTAEGEGGRTYLALFNLKDAPREVAYAYDRPCRVESLWTGEVTPHAAAFEGTLPAHGAVLLALEALA